VDKVCNSGDSRNGTRPNTVFAGVWVGHRRRAPRDRDGSFTPQIVRKRQGWLDGIDQIVLSLTARRLTAGEIGGIPFVPSLA
jgi:putative transposase